MKKEISSHQKWKEAFGETAIRCMNASHGVTRFSSVFSVLTQFSGNLHWALLNAMKHTVTKEISSDEKYNEALFETSL